MAAISKLYDGINKSADINDARNYPPEVPTENIGLPMLVHQELNQNALPKEKVKEITKHLCRATDFKLPKIGIRPVTHLVIKPPDHKSSIPGKLKNDINYVYYGTNLPVFLKMNPNRKILIPTEKSNLDNPGGIQNLMERCIVPPHADVSVAFKTKGNVPLLNPVKPTLFSQDVKMERVWDFQPHIYDTTVRLASSRMPGRPLTAIESVIVNSASPESSIESTTDQPSVAGYNETFRPIPGKKAPGWVVVIENGMVDDTTGAYAKFNTKIKEKDIKCVAFWIIDGIIGLSIKYSIPSIILDCETVINRCSDPLIYPLPYEVMMDCIYNKKTVLRILNKPGQTFFNAEIGRGLAVSLIQSRQELLELHRATRVFKHYWTIFKMRKRFYGIHKAKLKEAYSKFNEIQHKFVNSKEEFHAKLRILIVVVPKNFKKPNEFMDVERYTLLTRLFPLFYDPNLRMIIVLPFKHERFDEKLTEFFDIAHFPNPIESGKLHVVIPENAKHFENRSLTETSLYFSQFAMDKIKEICQKRNPILIADEFSTYIAGYLNCPYFGSGTKVEEQFRENKCILSNWINEAGTTVKATPKYWISKVKELESLEEQVREITHGRPEKLLWKLTRANNFEATADIVDQVLSHTHNEDFILGIWGNGGILEILPLENQNSFNIVEVGLFVQPNGEWKLVASSETKMVDEKPFGTYIPQQSISQQRILEVVSIISSLCKSKGVVGYLSLECMSENNLFKDIYISRIVPRLTYNVFRAVAVAVKARLVHDNSTFEMKTTYLDLHWNPPYLSKSQYMNKARVIQDYLTQVPAVQSRVAYYSDIADHNVIEDLNTRICAVKLTRHGVNFNDWTVDGVTFPYEEKSLAVLCIAQKKELALESYLAVLCAMEHALYDPDITISHNLLKVGQIVATELWEIKKATGYEAVPPQPNFTYSMKRLKYLLEPYMKNFYPEPRLLTASGEKEEDVPHNAISSAAIRLLTEEIPSVVAYQNDHSLKKIVPLGKLNKRNSIKSNQIHVAQKQLDQKIAQDKAGVLLEEVEILMDSEDPEEQKKLTTTPWHKLKKLPEE
ncbi:hypothetical protein HDV01_001368 [Terramyces sp. JEL0728]|nr:hypothetical protein HDV01_001368 [Terramyces sp. JEL0728]